MQGTLKYALRGGFGFRRRCFFDNHMGISAAEAERTDPGDTWPVGVSQPQGRFVGDFDWQRVPGNARAGLVEIQMGGNFLILQRQHHFDDAAHARRRFHVADIGFRRTQQQRPIRRTILAEYRTQCADFNGIAQRRAGAVRFNIIDLVCFQSGTAQRLTNDFFLRRPAGHGQTAAGAILVERRTANHGENLVAIPLRVGQAFEYQYPATFSAGVAIGGGIECLAVTVVGQHPSGGKITA